MQRHCEYNRLNKELVTYSKEEQRKTAENFIEQMKVEDLKNSYFLFTVSNILISPDFKRAQRLRKLLWRHKKILIENNIDITLQLI